MELKRIKIRSRVLLGFSIFMFLILVYAYAKLEWHMPNQPALNPNLVRGRILTEDGTILAQTIPGAKYGEFKRIYPQKTLAGQLIGVMGTDQGLSGLERFYEEELRAGHDVITSIDPWVQAIVEAHLNTQATENMGEYGSAIVLDTHSGKILAAATWPPFDPNKWRSYPDFQKQWQNRPFMDTYEPGSVVKALTVGAVMNDGLTTPNSWYDTPMARKIGGATIHDSVFHPPKLDTQHILRYSSNIGISHLVENYSDQQMYEYFKGYGIGQDIPLETLPAQGGILYNWKNWKLIQKVNMGFGQGLTTTTLQMAAAYNVLANDGRYIAPYLISADRIREEREVLRPETARTMRTMLRNVIEEGIPTAASVPGYQLGGKTGTAQVVVNGRYSSEIYNSVFAGFFPSNQPKVTMVVMVHGAKKNHHGSQLAAPIFRDVASEMLSAWGLPPEWDIMAEQKEIRLNRKP
ncbi:peptidoglycan D,D-transpeptidase FtsI family protein [Deinococcus roseus]|uniref:Penicillin-binding protein 2 n=1 Tax=Deinococcus roseus TaxID=392414 RepID=A0ABQ2CSZ7_9DEIO|nr:penicillin-binding protein 2 [Deinococcus roseus]GGJ18067.1 penicillin-binding protein 2 [Deinococcus roseus]